MRAVRFDGYGDVEVLEVRDVPDPDPGAGQVLVEVRAAGINPGEGKIRAGALHERWPATFPEGEGSDLAGVVRAVGAGVDGFAPGDEVLGFTDERASHAQLVLVESGNLVPKPAGVDWAAAGGLFIAGTSAYALVETADIGVDDVVVVSAAAGGVGSLTTQWARLTRATVVGLAGPDNHDWLRGHDIRPVDYHGADVAELADRITDAVEGRRVTALLDTFGPPYVELGVALGVEPDRIVTVADFAAADRGARLVFHSTVATQDVLRELATAVADGHLEVPVAATYPLDDVRAAFRDLESGHTRGKIVLVP